MKEHAKKALKHDFEVAGKTIPTLAVAVLFLVGTGSAALLSSFGTVSGTADVDSILTMGNDVEETFDASYADATGGEELISDPQTFNNHGEEPVQVSFTASETVVDGDGNEVSDSATGNTDTSFILYNQKNVSDGEDYAVSVNPVTGDSVQNGEYATEVTSSDTQTSDYATLWYEVDTDNLQTLKYYGDATESDVPASDEVYVITESGGKYVAAATNSQYDNSVDEGNSGTVQLDLTGKLYTYSEENGVEKADVTGSEVDIAAIGLGFGDGSADATRDVDVTVDNVRATDDSTNTVQLSETENKIDSLPIVSTTENTQYQFQSVTRLDAAFYTEGSNELEVQTTAKFAE